MIGTKPVGLDFCKYVVPTTPKTNIRSGHLQENPLVLETKTFQIGQSALNQKYELTFILICQKTIENRVMPSRLHIHTIEPSKSSMATSRSEIYNVFQILCCGFFFISISRSPRAQNCNDQNSERRLCIVLIHQTSNRIDFDSMK